MSEAAKGAFAIIIACTAWGLSAIFYKQLTHVPPLEVMAHRVLWSCVIFMGILLVRGRIGGLFTLLRPSKKLWLVAGGSLMISANWFIFIWAVVNGRVLETSLGYFMQPLAAVILAVWLFAERPKRAQWFAIALAAVAVCVLTLWLGRLPWLSLTLAVTFAFYGAIKKWSVEGPTVSVTAEALFVLPFALLFLGMAHFGGEGSGVFGTDLKDSLFLIFSGLLTAGPLVLMSYAAQRIPLATVGIYQYLNPTLQFLCATLLFAEPFTVAHSLAFALIWVALAIYTWSEFRRA